MATPTVTLSLNYSSDSIVSIPYTGSEGHILAVTVIDPETGFDITSQGTYTYNIINTQAFISISNSTAPSANVITTAVGGPTTISVTFTQASGVPGQWATTTSSTKNVVVTKGDQNVNFSPVGTKAVGDAAVSLTAYVVGNDSARYGAITFFSTNSAVVDISGSTATFLSAGTSELQALAAANDYYNQGVSTAENVTVTSSGGGGVACFTAGTMIRVPSGEVAVETLRRGDLVVTASGLVVPIKAALLTRVAKTTVGTAPYLIPAGTYGFLTQPRDLMLSPVHAFQIRKGVWMLPNAAAQMNPAIKQVAVGEPIAYFHLECPVYSRDNLVANGSIVESYGGFQSKTSPYTFSKRLGGFTRSATFSHATRA